jgi:hypothetical protein
MSTGDHARSDADAERDLILGALRFRVLRVRTKTFFDDIEAVVQIIANALVRPYAHAPPALQRAESRLVVICEAGGRGGGVLGCEAAGRGLEFLDASSARLDL